MQASKEQKKIQEIGKTVVIEESPSSSEIETPAKKKGKATSWVKPAVPELAFDLKSEVPPSIIDISSNTTENGESPKAAQNAEVTIEENAKEENVSKASKATAWKSQRSR